MTLKHLIMSTATAALIAGGAYAQSDSNTMETDAEPGAMQMDETNMTGDDSLSMAPMPQSLGEMTVGEVVGLNVVSSDGETIGEIDYLIARAEGPEMVIGIGGFLGLGEYTVALPLSEFDFDPETRVLTLPMDQETLEQRPEIDESDLEPLPDDMLMSQLMDMGDTDDAMTGEGTDSGS